MAKILIVEDDLTFSQLLEGFFKKHQHEPTVVHNIKNAYRFLDQKEYDLLLVDYRLPDGTGLDILSYVNAQGLNLPLVIMTSFNDVRTAVKSIQQGASDYITKPVNPDELLMIVKNALENDKEEDVAKAPADDETIKGHSPSADKLYEHISLVAPTDMSVIIQGESGTG